MGLGFSSICKPSSAVAFKNVRLVHLDGRVEEFESGVRVSQVTGKPPNHVVCTPAHLLTVGFKPLESNFQLEAGRIYLILPLSTLQFDASPAELAMLVKKLTNIAKRKPSTTTPPPANRIMRRLSDTGAVAYGVEKCGKSLPRPLLDTIEEISSNRKSVSDFQSGDPNDQKMT